MATVAPSAASAVAIPRPNPFEAPVTSATRPSSPDPRAQPRSSPPKRLWRAESSGGGRIPRSDLLPYRAAVEPAESPPPSATGNGGTTGSGRRTTAPRGESPRVTRRSALSSASPSAHPVGTRKEELKVFEVEVSPFAARLRCWSSLATALGVGAPRPPLADDPAPRAGIASSRGDPPQGRSRPRRGRRAAQAAPERRRRVRPPDRSRGAPLPDAAGAWTRTASSARSRAGRCGCVASAAASVRHPRRSLERSDRLAGRLAACRARWSGSPSASPAAIRARSRATGATAASTSSCAPPGRPAAVAPATRPTPARRTRTAWRSGSTAPAAPRRGPAAPDAASSGGHALPRAAREHERDQAASAPAGA